MHIPVLLQETVGGLAIQAGDRIVDATINGGGHSSEICRRFGEAVHIYGFDRDAQALERARATLGDHCNYTLIQDNYRHMAARLAEHGVETVERVLLDLGLSSEQLDNAGRGFSFQREEPLIMTYENERSDERVTAADLVNSRSEAELAELLWELGGEPHSRRIARAIVRARESAPIETTKQLADIVSGAVPAWYRHRKTHCATKTFQALRIAVNEEYTSLIDGLAAGFELLAADGRMAVITFHSGEDRIVKQYFNRLTRAGRAAAITKKPIAPTRAEVVQNPRARSAKLRLIEKHQ